MEMTPLLFLGIILGLLAYFVPALVAVKRMHHQTSAILALNLLLGWTFIGWVAALVWALTAVKKPNT